MAVKRSDGHQQHKQCGVPYWIWPHFYRAGIQYFNYLKNMPQAISLTVQLCVFCLQAVVLLTFHVEKSAVLASHKPFSSLAIHRPGRRGLAEDG